MRYQSQAFIYFSMKLTTLFALHSRKVWIHTCMQYTRTHERHKGLSPPNLIVWCCMHIHAHPRTALYVKLHAWAFPCALTPGIICTNTRNYLRGAVSTITHTDIKIQAERRSSLQLVSHRALARALLWRVGVFELVFFEQNEGPHYSWCHAVLWRTRCFGA